MSMATWLDYCVLSENNNKTPISEIILECGQPSLVFAFLPRTDVVSAMKIICWLAKEEVAHTTKYESSLDLAVSLRCSYLNELHVADDANYISEGSISYINVYGQFSYPHS